MRTFSLCTHHLTPSNTLTLSFSCGCDVYTGPRMNFYPHCDSMRTVSHSQSHAFTHTHAPACLWCTPRAPPQILAVPRFYMHTLFRTQTLSRTQNPTLSHALIALALVWLSCIHKAPPEILVAPTFYVCTLCRTQSPTLHGWRRLNLKSLRLPKFRTGLHGSPCNFSTSSHGNPQDFKQILTGVNGSLHHSKEWTGKLSNLKMQIFKKWSPPWVAHTHSHSCSRLDVMYI